MPSSPISARPVSPLLTIPVHAPQAIRDAIVQGHIAGRAREAPRRAPARPSRGACWGESCRALRADVAEDLSTVFIRGTKRSTRLRTVPIVGETARSLLEYVLTHAAGEGGLLFRPWSNVRRDLHAACDAVKIRRCSPNDLRRTAQRGS